VRNISNSSQSETDRLLYDAFGQIVSRTASEPTPFLFAGGYQYQTDKDTTLQLLGNRYYDPSIGRFLSKDPAKDGGNWYAYCGNNPVTGVDPEGLQDYLRPPHIPLLPMLYPGLFGSGGSGPPGIINQPQPGKGGGLSWIDYGIIFGGATLIGAISVAPGIIGLDTLPLAEQGSIGMVLDRLAWEDELAKAAISSGQPPPVFDKPTWVELGHGHWGDPYESGYLPPGESYTIYDPPPIRGEKNRGPRRLVVSESGKVYYTQTHGEQWYTKKGKAISVFMRLK
jgi:RHS repeat-associated protein